MSDAGMPDAIWAWRFDLSQQNEVLHGGWCGDRDKKEVRYLAATPERDAAPDLLAALGPLIVIALDNLDGMNAETREEFERDIATARAAIAKVRGQS